uniref:Uncharacterized protein n=1 Tax=Phyllostachys edulis TaxID=38705 RepID=D3IVR9_PHYED|nr:hypothetical protein [Phyllostachys edulis]
MYDRAFIQQKYMLNYSMRAENFVRWKPYVPDPVEEAPKEPKSQDMDDFDIPAQHGQSRDKGKGKAHAAEPGRHSVSGRPSVIRIHDDMDDFDIPARRGQSCDKGKGKAHAAKHGCHSVSGRPGVIRIHDDMDDFDIPAPRGQSRDKGKGKAGEEFNAELARKGKWPWSTQ